MNAYGYCRVSTAEQQDSIQVQTETIQRYYAYALEPKKYAPLVFFKDEKVSGRLPFFLRPNGAKLKDVLQAGDVLVISKLDRGFRNLLDLLQVTEELDKRGVKLCLLDLGIEDTSSPAGKLVVRLLGVCAEFERDRITERIRECHAVRKAMGMAPSGRYPPYGFKRVKRKAPDGRMRCYLARDDADRATGAAIVEWRTNGWTCEEIYWHLNDNGFTRWGKRWTRSMVQAVYCRELQLRALEAKKEQEP